LPLEYHPLFKDLIRHILFTKNKGNTTKLAVFLSNWYADLDNKINALPEEGKDDAIREIIAKNKLVKAIKELPAFKELKSIGVKTAGAEAKSEAEAFYEVESVASDSSESESSESPSEADFEEAFDEFFDAENPESVEDILVETSFLESRGQFKKAERLYEKTEKTFSKKTQSEQKNADAAVENSRNTLYLKTFLLYQQQHPDNPKKSYDYQKKMADLGVAAAQNSLAVRYFYGTDIKQNYAEALRLFELAAAKNYAQALYNLGTAYHNGIKDVVVPDPKQALKHFQAAAKQDHPEAQHYLSIYFNQKKDFVQSTSWLRKAAENGHAPSQYNMAILHMEGKETAKKDENLALDYLRSSAAQDYVPAQEYLAIFYGKKGNIGEALKYYIPAAEQGSLTAQYHLGLLYFSGSKDVVEQDFETSAKYFKAAAAQGHQDSLRRLIVTEEIIKRITENSGKGR